MRLHAFVIACLLVTLLSGGLPAQTSPAATSPTAAVESPPPEMASPQATMFTFLNAMSRTDEGSPAQISAAWAEAISTLDTSPLRDAAEARLAAERLLGVLDRLGEVSRDELPDAEGVAQTGLSRFRYFPRQPEHAWVWKELKPFQKSPDGQIVLERNPTTGAWRFSARTVAGIGALHESTRDLPPRYLPADAEPFDLLGSTFRRTRFVGWLALLGAIFVGLVFGKLVQTAMLGASRRLVARGWTARAAAFEDAAAPASLALLTLGLTVGLQFIYLEPDVRGLALKVLQFLYLLALGWVLYNLIDVIEIALRQLTGRTSTRLDDMVVPLIRKALRIFLVVIFTLVVAQNIFGLNITGWLAGLGIAGLAVSLAAQDSIKNLFGSMTVFFDQPFSVGDRIKFDGFDGVVEEIGFRSSKVRTLEGHLATIPNMKFIDGSVENVGARPHIRRILNVTITYDTPPEKIEEAVSILQAILQEPSVAEPLDPAAPAQVAFDEYNADSLNIKVFYWYHLGEGRDYWGYLRHAQTFNLKIFRSFAKAGIEFAFPTQTLLLAGDPARALEVRLGELSPTKQWASEPS